MSRHRWVNEPCTVSVLVKFKIFCSIYRCKLNKCEGINGKNTKYCDQCSQLLDLWGSQDFKEFQKEVIYLRDTNEKLKEELHNYRMLDVLREFKELRSLKS